MKDGDSLPGKYIRSFLWKEDGIVLNASSERITSFHQKCLKLFLIDIMTRKQARRKRRAF